MRKGMLLVMSGPSGAGKGMLKKMLIQRLGGFYFSISCTARPLREGQETDGIDYHFITEEQFNCMLTRGEFLESATVHGYLYGTPMGPIRERLAQGHDILLEIDTQGALQVQEKMKDCVSVFILPPSFTVLEKRLRTRNTENEQDIAMRLRNARNEVSELYRYQYTVVNDQLEEAYQLLEAIVIAERQRTCRYQPTIV